MDKLLISVVVPIYNVEAYVNRCIESLVNQTYKNLEIILVDDGSPDNCPQMCDMWAEKDNRIKVIHKENGGLSDARNAGMIIATGEYISFIDSDDYISLDFIEELCSTAIENEADIVECSVVNCYEDGSIDDFKDDMNCTVFEKEDALSGLIAEHPFHQHVWNKLYRASIALTVPFAVGKLNEDEFWTYQIFGKAKSVVRLNKTMYYYLQRSSSIMGERYSIRRLDVLEAKAKRQEYIENQFPRLADQAKIDMFGSCIYAYQCVLRYLKGTEKRRATGIVKKYAQLFKPTYSDIRNIKGSSKKYYIMAIINFYFCCKIRAIARIGF